VMVDRGTLQGGFGAPVVVAADVREFAYLHVALAASGTAYVVWSNGDGKTTVSAAAPGEPFSPPRQLLPPRTNLVGLLQGSTGPVVVVWQSSLTSRSPPLLHYARLLGNGGLGQVVTVGRIARAHVAVNDRGEFAAVGVTNNGFPGLGPTRPVVALCNEVERCSKPRAIRVGEIGIADEAVEDGLTLSDNGTLTVFAMSVENKHECRRVSHCAGLWSEVRRPGGRWLGPHELSPTAGGWELDTISDGAEAALALYSRTATYRIAGRWSAMEADGARITRPAPVDAPAGYQGPRGIEEPQLAADDNGQFAAAWCTVAHSEIRSDGVATPCSRVTAAVGHDDHLETAQLISAGGEEPLEDEIRDGMDAVGEVAVIWSGSPGISIAVYHPPT